MTQQIDDRYINIDEAAQFLCIKKSWLYQNHKLVGIPSFYIGRKLVFNIYEIDAWVQNRTRSA
jgi:predicted DNA-binding transcriptional regulator AlpA